MLMWFMLMLDFAFIIIMNKFKFKLFTRLCTAISMDADRCIQLDGTIIILCSKLYSIEL